MEKYNRQLRNAIIEGNAILVKQLIEEGAAVNGKNVLYKYDYAGRKYSMDETPLQCAFAHNQYEIVKLLVDCGAEMPGDNSPLIQAVAHRRPELFVYMVAHGAVIEKTKAAVEQLLSWLADGRWDAAYIPAIDKLRLPVRKYGGYSLYLAAQENQLGMVQWLLTKQVNINARDNFNKKTPLYGAAANNHFEVVKYLAEQGADVTITDDYGIRPYIAAKRNHHVEVAEYIRSLEPAELHSEQAQEKLFADYHVPPEMAEYLKNGKLYLEFPDDAYIQWIQLSPYMDVCEMKFNSKKVLLVLEDCSDQDILLVWEPKVQKLYVADLETSRMRKAGAWETFIQNPVKCLNKAIEWARSF